MPVRSRGRAHPGAENPAFAGRQGRAGAALMATLALVAACTAPTDTSKGRRPTGSGTVRSSSPSPAVPALEQPATAVSVAMRRAVAGMAKVSETVEPKFQPGRKSVTQLTPCALPTGFSAPLIEGLVDVNSFYVGSLKTAPAVYRVGGVRAEAAFTLKVLAARPEVVRWATQKVRDVRCQAGVLHLVPPPAGGVVPYRRASGAVSVAGNAAVAVTTRLIPDDLEPNGYYPLLGHVRVIATYRSFMIEVGVLCGRPGRPRDGKAVADEARRRALTVTDRMIAELRKGAEAQPVPATPT